MRSRYEEPLLTPGELAAYLDHPAVVATLKNLDSFPARAVEQYRVRDLLSEGGVTVSHVLVLSQSREGGHTHKGNAVIRWLSGDGEFVIGLDRVVMVPGVEVFVPGGTTHNSVAEKGSAFLSAQNPPFYDLATGDVDFQKR